MGLKKDLNLNNGLLINPIFTYIFFKKGNGIQ